MATTGDNRQYNNRCMYVLTGPCNTEQVATAMAKIAVECERLTGHKCFYDINLPIAYDGKPRCCAYMYFSNPEMYWILLGKNPDGSERVEYYDDPEWICPERETKTFTNWADEVEEEELYICPQLSRPLPPLIDIPPIVLTTSQIEWMTENSPETDPTIYRMKFSSAFVVPVEPPYLHNKIVCGGIESWMTEADLKRLFGKYSTSRNRDFPKYEIRGNRGIITYDPHTTDGQFAMIMMKKRTIHSQGKTVNLFCNFFFTDKSRHK